MSSRLQLDMRNLSLARRHLVNAYEVEAGIGVIAGNTANIGEFFKRVIPAPFPCPFPYPSSALIPALSVRYYKKRAI